MKELIEISGDPKSVFIERGLIKADFAEAEKAVMALHETYPQLDRYMERAKKDGITREEAKAKMFHEDYGCGTGVKDWKKDLRKLIVKNG